MADLDDDYEQMIEGATRLLPAWFIPRMMTDEWSFGLLLSGGLVLAISHIDSIHRGADGSLWLDVEMIDDVHFIAETWGDKLPMPIVGAPTARLRATVNAAHVVWAFELADT